MNRSVYMNGIIFSWIVIIYIRLWRTTKAENVNIMDSENIPSIYSNQFIKQKIAGYKTQDKAKRRDTDLSVQDVEELIKIGNKCYRCEIDLDKSNMTIDRIDNSHGHIKGNVRLACLSCNRARMI
jgi:hypothetical protein